MRVLVYGLGRSGLAALELCHRQGHQLSFVERRRSGADIDTALALGATRVDPLPRGRLAFDVCIAAPGVAFDHPDLVALRRAGVETIGEVEWVYRTVPADIVGVTGTAGKGSTTLWISRCLSATGLDAPAGGNLDPALARVARPGAILVAELSSFQLERCPTLKPRVAVVLNVGSDHLDRHGSLDAYRRAKQRIVDNLGAGEVLVFNADDAVASGWAAQTPARSLGFSLQRHADAWLREYDQTLMLGGAPLLTAGDLKVGGRHQVANALAVALACAALGLGLEEIRRGLASFEGLPSRYAHAGRLGATEFIDDSIATRALAVRAALDTSAAPVVWIGGGQDKGASFEELEPTVRTKVALFIGVGASGAAFAERVAAWTDTAVCAETDGEAALRCAIDLGYRHLRDRHGGRGTVLLAPLAASFDQFDDYAHRGRVFRQLVAELIAAQQQPLEAPWTPS